MVEALAAREIMAFSILWEVPAGLEEGEVAVAAQQFLVVSVMQATPLVVGALRLKAAKAALVFSRAQMLGAILLEQVEVARGL